MARRYRFPRGYDPYGGPFGRDPRVALMPKEQQRRKQMLDTLRQSINKRANRVSTARGRRHQTTTFLD
jgi:hypothetical protein